MNKVIISGRLARDPDIRYSQGAEPIAVTRITVAVNRRFKREGEPDADFIGCIAFGKTAEFISKYFTKGKMIGIAGNIRTNSWTDQSGQKKYSTEVYIDEAEFLESKAASEANQNSYQPPNQEQAYNNNPMPNNNEPSNDDFYSIESGVDDDNLPF
ncbi:MAG: single-stranded DNA-binding protein [Eubacteriales bacterium]|nr:single-stranded DNA-binding protein [Eubacteriales bacterium]